MTVEKLLKKYIKSEKKRKAFMKEAIKKNLVFDECSGPVPLDKKYLNDRHCTMCGKVLDFWDIYKAFSIEKYIGYGSAGYDMTTFRATLCWKCTDKLIDTILPMFKYKFPLTPCLWKEVEKKDLDKELEKETKELKERAEERIKKRQAELKLENEQKTGH